MIAYVKMYGRIAGVLAGAAFLISLLVGAIVRNPFGVILPRALLMGGVFCALGAGAQFFARRFLLGTPGAITESNTPKPGFSIDIELPEENPLRREPPGAIPSVESVIAEQEAKESVEQTRESTEYRWSNESAGYRWSTEAEAGMPGDTVAAEELAGPLGSEEGEELAAVTEDIESAPAGKESSLDSLPDISSMEVPPGGDTPRGSGGPSHPGPVHGSGAHGGVSGTKGRSAAAGKKARKVAGGMNRPEEEIAEVMGGQDPGSLARAIRTVLKRDEKG